MSKPMPWPFPAHSVQDRDRFIGQTYRSALLETSPDTCAALDQYLAGFGITWPHTVQREPSADFLTRADVAALAEVRPDTVSQWTARGYLTRTPDGYARIEVEDFLARERPYGRRQSAARAAELDL